MLSPTQFLACLLLLSSTVSASVSETKAKETEPTLPVAASREPAEAKSAPAAPIDVKTSQPSATHVAQVPRTSQSIANVHYEQPIAYARPSPAQASVSLGQLMNGLYSTLSKRMSRRSGKGSALDLYNTLQQGANDYNLGNLNMNDVLNSAMVNNAQFASSLQASGLASQLITLGKGKKLLDLPKQFYKTLGEKISGAGEAAAMATVPLKDSFMNTLKSFYSYIKPARSSQAEAPAAASPSSADPGSAANSMFNFKRRTSEIHPYYQQQQQQFNKNAMTLEQFLYNGGSFGTGYPGKQQAEGMIMEASMPDLQAHLQAQQQQLSRGASKSMAPHPGHPNELIKHQQQSNLGQLEYLRPEIIGNDHIYAQFIAQQPSQGLYQKSKQFFSKISRRRFGQSNGNILKQQQQQAAVAAMNPGYMFASAPVETIMQQPQQGLSGQTIAKVQSKLGSLPSVYNTNLQQQQSQVSSVSSPSSSNSLVASASQPQATWAVAKPKRPIASYYTHQPSYHYPGQYIKTKQQQTQQVNFPTAQAPATLAETSSSSSSTQSPAVMLSTSTSIVSSISVHNAGVEEANEPSEENADNHGMKDKNDATLFYYDESHLTGGADDAAAKHLDHADSQQESRSSSN